MARQISTPHLLIAASAALFMASAVFAGDEPDLQRELLAEDFDAVTHGELPRGWRADGDGWGVVEGELRGSALEGRGETTVWFGASSWRNVAVEARLKFEKVKEGTRWCALLVRDDGPTDPGFQLTVRRDADRGNGLELAARRPLREGSDWRVLMTAAGAAPFRVGEWHRLRIEARGGVVEGFVDGERVFTSLRGDELALAGRAGLRVNGAAVRFDSVRVVDLGDTLPPAGAHRTRPLVIAHRGFSAAAPENTLAAYRLAIEAGAEMAECDVHLTKDRIPVLLHDRNLQRTCGLDADVDSQTLEEVRRLRIQDERFPDEQVPTLVEALQLVRGKLRFVIEIKGESMEEEVVAAIRESGTRPEDVMIFAFERDSAAAIAKLEPLLPTTWLIDELPWRPAEQREVIQKALAARASALGLSWRRAEPGFLRLAHESGFQVFCWTVNDPADMAYLAGLGVDGIISDRPDVLLRVLQR